MLLPSCLFLSLYTLLDLRLNHAGIKISDLNTLGDQIHANLKPLEGLGDMINAQIQRELRPLQADLSNRMSELDGLSDKISQSVQESLEPVRAIELNFKLRDGVGGMTIVTHRPSGRQFLMKNNETFTCSGRINDNGNCSGTLDPFHITESSPRSDWCFPRSYSIVNNDICLSNGGVFVTLNNDQVTCQSINNNTILHISLDEYKEMCASISRSAEYRYIPDENDPAHVSIPNVNRYVKCENRQKNYCIFKEMNEILDTYYSNGSGGVTIIHNGGSVAYF